MNDFFFEQTFERTISLNERFYKKNGFIEQSFSE